MALSSLDTNKYAPLLARDCEPVSSDPLSPVSESGGPLRQRQRRLTEPDVARMVARYAEGATVYELAEEFGIERRTVAARLKKASVSMRHQPATAEQVAEMVRLYKSGLSLAKVAPRTGVSAKTVLNYLRAEGVQLRDTHGRGR